MITKTDLQNTLTSFKSNLATVASTGNYNDLSNLPDLSNLSSSASKSKVHRLPAFIKNQYYESSKLYEAGFKIAVFSKLGLKAGDKIKFRGSVKNRFGSSSGSSFLLNFQKYSAVVNPNSFVEGNYYAGMNVASITYSESNRDFNLEFTIPENSVLIDGSNNNLIYIYFVATPDTPLVFYNCEVELDFENEAYSFIEFYKSCPGCYVPAFYSSVDDNQNNAFYLNNSSVIVSENDFVLSIDYLEKNSLDQKNNCISIPFLFNSLIKSYSITPIALRSLYSTLDKVYCCFDISIEASSKSVYIITYRINTELLDSSFTPGYFMVNLNIAGAFLNNAKYN